MRSLSYKIGLGYFVLIVVNVAIAAFAIYYIHLLGSPVDRVLREKYQNLSSAGNMVQAMNQQELALQTMVDEKVDSTLINSFHTYKNEFYNWHQRAVEGIALPTEPIILDSIMINFREYQKKAVYLQNLLMAEGNRQFPQDYYRQVILPLAQKVEQQCQRLAEVNQQAISETDQRARLFSRRATFFILGFALVAIAISVLASIRFTRGILKPVKATTETVKRIGEGQLNQKINITTDDEIAELGREFNKMTERLSAYEQMNIDQILLEKKKSEAIVSGMPVSIIVTDETGKISLMNRQAVQLLEAEQIPWEGNKISEVVKHQSLIDLLTPSVERESLPGEILKTMISINRGGQELYFIARQIDIRIHEEKLKGRVTALQDVTSFKDLDRLKSDFMATISHEFRTPLTSINMVVDILLREVRGGINPDQRELLEDAQKDGQRLKLLVRELLELSRLEAGKFPFQFTPVNIRDVIDYSIEPLRPVIAEKKIRFSSQITADPGKIRADFRQLARVIMNLVENAVQHTGENGEVNLDVSDSGGEFTVCVSDSGEGIPGEALDFIFDKFVQIRNFEDAESGNIGLGLAIAREIVTAHGGRIWVESEVDRGSRFYFTVPKDPGPENS